MYNQKNTVSLLKAMSFERFGGTAEELKAAKLIQEELKKINLSSKLESFPVQMGKISKAKLEICEPFQGEIKCNAYMCCANTPANGIEAEFYYFEQASEVNIKDAKNKICLVNGFVGKKLYKDFVKAGALALISFNGNIDFPDGYDMDRREMRTTLTEIKNMPAVNILVNDALMMIKRNVTKVKITTVQEVTSAKSHNIVCDIKGSESDDVIVLTAHYDSVRFSKGAYDNATGSVCLYALADYFSKHQPKHTLRFIWCGSEERGLLGSKAYVHKHTKELHKIKLCINIDMIGSALGKRVAVCTADLSLVHCIDYLGKVVGFSIDAKQDVYSSDSTPFADVDVPAVSFARIAPKGAGEIHHKYDVIDHLSDKYLFEDINFILEFTKRMANAYIIPVPCSVPQNMKDAIDAYYGRDKSDKNNTK